MSFLQTKLGIECGSCNRQLTITIQQIVDEVSFDCPHCGKEIALRDENGSFKQAAEDMERLQNIQRN